jgi:hypothetical protein
MSILISTFPMLMDDRYCMDMVCLDVRTASTAPCLLLTKDKVIYPKSSDLTFTGMIIWFLEDWC